MQWERLISELEADLDAEERRELAGEVADRTRRELARLRLVDRLRAAVGEAVTVGVRGTEPVNGRLIRVGPDWLLLDPVTQAAELLVPTGAITWLGGLPGQAVDPVAVPVVDQRLGLGSVLRAVARDRRVVQVRLRDGGEIGGVVARVGADYIDVADGPRAGGQRCVPFTAIAAVRMT